MRQAVLDASALMTLLYNRPGTEKVAGLLDRATEGKVELFMSVVNWGEAYYSVWRAEGKDAAERILIELARLPIKIVMADLELTKLAAELRVQYKLPYADCFAAALARQRGATLATGDNDFRLVAKQVNILWTN